MSSWLQSSFSCCSCSCCCFMNYFSFSLLALSNSWGMIGWILFALSSYNPTPEPPLKSSSSSWSHSQCSWPTFKGMFGCCWDWSLLRASVVSNVKVRCLLGIYAPNTFPYQIRILYFLFWFFSFINSLPLQIYHMSCLELVHYSTLCNIRFSPWVILSHWNEGPAGFKPFS